MVNYLMECAGDLIRPQPKIKCYRQLIPAEEGMGRLGDDLLFSGQP